MDTDKFVWHVIKHILWIQEINVEREILLIAIHLGYQPEVQQFLANPVYPRQFE